MTHLNDSEYYSTSLILRANNGVNKEDSINNLLTQIIMLPSLFLRQIFKGKCIVIVNFIGFCLSDHILSSSYRLEFQSFMLFNTLITLLMRAQINELLRAAVNQRYCYTTKQHAIISLHSSL